MKWDDLQDYIIQNNKTEDVLIGLGCTNIKKRGTEYRCSSENHPNSTSICVKIETLKTKIYTKEETIRGNIYTLAMDLMETNSFPKAVKEIHRILGLSNTSFKRNDNKPKVDILGIWNKTLKRRKKRTIVNELNILEDDITNEYIKMPYIEWIREGILPYTQDIFGVGYSPKYNRVCFPHRLWCGNENDYVGMIGRTLNKDYKILDIPKYFPLHPYPKSNNLFGLQENYKGIQEKGEVSVGESEKSVMKRHSKCDYTWVATMGHEISDEQVRILISLNVKIIIQMDSDIPEEFIWSLCEKFYGIRPISYTYDHYGLMNNMESPADKHEKIYQALYKRQIEYTKEYHDKYIKYLEERRCDD